METNSRIPIYKKKWLWATSLGLALTIFFSYYASTSIRYPLSLDGNEGFILVQARAYIVEPTLKSLYPPLDKEPYFTNPYPPLFIWLTAGAMRQFNLPMDNTLGRAISLGSLLVCATMLYVMLRRLVGRYAAYIGATAFVFTGPILGWASLNRIDVLGLALTLVGIGLLTSRRGALVWLSLPCFILALFTKFTFVAAPLAAVIYLARLARWRAAWYAVLLAGGIALPFWLLQWATDGQFAVHTLSVNMWQRFYAAKILAALEPMTVWPIFFLLVPFISFLWLWWRRQVVVERESSLWFWLFYLGFTTWSLLGRMRAGAGENYFFEFEIAAIVFGIAAWRELSLSIWRPLAEFLKQHSYVVVIFCLLNLLIVKNIMFAHTGRLAQAYSNLPEYLQVLRRLDRAGEGKLLDAEMLFAPFVRLDNYLTGSRTFVQMSYLGKWDQSRVLEIIRTRDFKVVVLSSRWGSLDTYRYNPRDGNAPLTEEMAIALRENYEQVATFADQVVYYPKPW